jgi:hypothetical protein
MEQTISKRRLVIIALAVAFVVLLFVSARQLPFSRRSAVPDHSPSAQVIVSSLEEASIFGEGFVGSEIGKGIPQSVEVLIDAETVFLKNTGDTGKPRLARAKRDDVTAGSMISVYVSPRPFEEVVREPVPRAATLPFEEAVERPRSRILAQYVVIQK